MFGTLKFIIFSAVAMTSSFSTSTVTYTYTAEVTPEIQKTISEKIYDASQKYEVDSLQLLNIACAESCMRDNNGNIIFNSHAKNPNSTASGIFQFIKGTWESMCKGDVFNEDDNIECAAKILATSNGIRHWEASRLEGFGGGWGNKPYEKFKILN